ncbi:MAG: HAMP domain-containing histidine kinase [Clostridia bacterium]|nr:HAMP domain-containing histidine kinase [Clostridia bacterium]
MKISFRWKVVSVFLAVIFVSMLALTLLSNVLLKPIFIINSKNTMLDYAEKISQHISDSEKTEELLEEINLSYGINTHLANNKGEITVSYSKIKLGEVRYKYSRYIKLYNEQSPEKGYIFKNRFDDTNNEKKIVFVCKADDDSYIIMTKAIKGIEQDINIVSVFIMIVGCTMAVMGTLVWSIFSKSFTDNMKKMSRITRNMSELNFDEKINYKSNDEIGLLADSIDALSEELKKSIEGLKNDIEHRKRLVRDISHELKTPITTVKGYLENIQVMTAENERLQRYCTIAAEECEEINALVEEMLEMSRMESDSYFCDMERTPTALIAETVENKTDTEYHGQRVSISFEPAEIMCNSILITRAIMNFVKNGVKYGEKNQEIEILGTRQADKYVFSVTNRGAPIPQEERDCLWDLFYKNDKARKRDSSHGIGLAMVKRTAEIHGGQVGIVCRDGKNTFYFSVPLDK